MKNYPFPPGVSSMTDGDYRDHCAREHAKAVADKAARAKRRAEPSRIGPSPVIRAMQIGASHLFRAPRYTRTSQLSSALRAAYIATGHEFESKVSRDLLTGETVTGVTVTRIK